MFLAVEAPDFISGLALQDRLRSNQAKLISGEAGETLLMIDQQVPLVPLLASIREWMDGWRLEDVTLRLRTKTYVLQQRRVPSLGWTSDQRVLLELESVDLSADAAAPS